MTYADRVSFFVFRIMFFQIRVFRKLGRIGLGRVINYAYYSSEREYMPLSAKLQDGGKQQFS